MQNYGGLDVETLASEAAREADSDRVVSLLEPKIYVIDVVMAELVKQVKWECQSDKTSTQQNNCRRGGAGHRGLL